MTRVIRGKLVPASLSLFMVLATLAILPAAPALANHGTRTLEIGNCTSNPAVAQPCPDSNDTILANEIESNGVTELHTVRAVLRNSTGSADAPADVASGPINIDFEIESGPADPDSNPGNSPTSPDLTCSIEVTEDSCEVQYVSNQTGSNTIRAWIDHDQSNAQVVNDPYDGTEARWANNTTDCGDTPVPDPQNSPDCNTPSVDEPAPMQGAINDPDGTDVIRKSWTAGPAANLDCEPETATKPSTGSGSAQTYTCTVTDALGNPKNGVEVEGENMNGANDPDNSSNNATADYDHQTSESGHFCTTGSNGQCSDTIDPIDAEAGSANICFWADTDSDDVFAPGGTDQEDGGDCDVETTGQNDDDLTDTVTLTWETRAASGIDAEPESDSNPTADDPSTMQTDNQHTITATVYDQFGQTFQGGTTVEFEFFQGSPKDTDGNTPQSPDMQCTTNNSTSCSQSYTNTVPGRDLVCVWTGADPTMSGNNTNGTCNGEGANDADDDPSQADAPEPANDRVDVVEKIWTDPNAASQLDCNPETDTNPTGTQHTVTCTAKDQSGDPVSGANIDAEATGANDPDQTPGDSKDSPDFTCTTQSDNNQTPENEAGTCSFNHTGNNAGLTTYRAWIDSDNSNATEEADDGEGRDEAATPGAQSENPPDGTDVVEKSWGEPPASITMTPDQDSASVGTCNAFTITALNANNQPVQGATIDVEQRHERANNQTGNDEPTVSFCTPTAQDGPNPSNVDETKGDLRPPDESPDNPGTAGGETTNPTDSAGKVTIGIRVVAGQNSDGTGSVTVDAFFDPNNNDDPDQGEPKDTSTKTWVAAEGRTIDCNPETATQAAGSGHAITCTVLDRFGQPVEAEGVTFTSSGVGSVSPTTASTNAQGQATTTATSSTGGTQTVTGTITDDTTGAEPGEADECDKAAGDPSGSPAGACSDDVTVNWTEDQTTQCNDGVDNDGDGQVDFPGDPGCDDAQDDTENSEGPETFTFNSNISINYAKGDFKGKVTTTGDARCVRNRRVKVFKVRDGADKVVGRDRTNDNGRWRVEKPGANGRFYAKVTRKEITLANGDVIVCKPAKSKTIKV